MPQPPPLLPALVALAVALVLTPLAARLATWAGALDEPGARRVHQSATPRLGGLSLYAAFLAGALAGGGIGVPVVVGGLASMLLVVVGTFDDLFELRPALRLVVQVLAAEVVTSAGIRFPGVGAIATDLAGAACATPVEHAVTLLWLVGMTNAVNLLDGLDLLAAGLSLVATALLLVLAGTRGGPVVSYQALAGALAGVGFYNRFPARIFLGDCGSTFLGFFLACAACVEAGALSPHPLVCFVPPLLLAVPLFDTTYAVVRRLYRGVSPLSPDRGHVHHRLLAAGLDQVEAVRRIIALSGALGLLSLGVGLGPWPLGLASLATGALLVGWFAHGLRLFTHDVMRSPGTDADAPTRRSGPT